MAKLQIKVKSTSDHTLHAHKKIKLGSKSIETPFKAIQIGKTTKYDQINDKARGFNEIYTPTSVEKLKKAESDRNSKIQKRIGSAKRKSEDGEFDIVFIKIKSPSNLNESLIEYVSDIIYTTSDFFTIPLMSDLTEKIDGKDSPHFKKYIELVQEFIRFGKQINGKPIVGTLPFLPSLHTFYSNLLLF